MKIIAINAEHTRGAHDAAFEVDAVPDLEALSRVDYGSLHISFDGAHLKVRASENDHPLDEHVVETINAKYAEAKKTVISEREKKQKRHESDVAYLAQLTGLPIR